MNNQTRIGNRAAKHAYEIEIAAAGYVTIIVDANTRTQAANVAKKHGFKVRSVNMIG